MTKLQHTYCDAGVRETIYRKEKIEKITVYDGTIRVYFEGIAQPEKIDVWENDIVNIEPIRD